MRLNDSTRGRTIWAAGAGLGLVLTTVVVAMLTSCNRGSAEGPQGPPVMPVKVRQVGLCGHDQVAQFSHHHVGRGRLDFRDLCEVGRCGAERTVADGD